MKLIGLFYGGLSYLLFLASFIYAIGFLANWGVPRTVDSGGPQQSFLFALIVDMALLLLFAVQHSVMARQGFKRVWTRIVPKPLERSTYVLLSSLILLFMFWYWHPIPALVWDIPFPMIRVVIWVFYGMGWLLVLAASFQINHFDLFGLSQVWYNAIGKQRLIEPFKTPVLYRIVRHPLYTGWFMVFWITPTMTLGHLIFALLACAYILVAIPIEEKDLISFHSEYAEYRKRVPMLFPRLRKKK